MNGWVIDYHREWLVDARLGAIRAQRRETELKRLRAERLERRRDTDPLDVRASDSSYFHDGPAAVIRKTHAAVRAHLREPVNLP